MSADARPPAIFLMGPTASGKTDLAVGLAASLPLEVVSVDSALVYRGLDIGTAKPDADTRARVPHHLIDIVEPEQPYSAGRFRDDALAAMAAIIGRGRVPLLVGGTMMYFRALDGGLGPMPPADPAVRAALEAELRERGPAALHADLAGVDPRAAARIHANDPQRIQRALEVYRISGRPISAFHGGFAHALDYRVLRLVVAPEDRARLHTRIERRFHDMLAAGLVEEVERLRRRPRMRADLPSMRAVGYRQVWQYLEGTLDHATMVERGIVATRGLARRQLTWLRAMDDVERLAGERARVAHLHARIERWLGQGATHATTT